MADHTEMKPGALPRVAGVDVARGLAAALMIQGHVFDAFASPAARAASAYLLERAFLQTLALPAFFVISGASLALRVEAALQRGEEAPKVRRAIVRRGLGIALAGYALNAFSALLDGWEGPETWLRADVLQGIGFSLAWLGFVGVRGHRSDGVERNIRETRLVAVALSTATVPILLCPFVSPLGALIPRELGWMVAFVIDVPRTSRFPMVPLMAWTAIGVLVGRWMIGRNRSVRSPAGASDADLGILGTLCLLVAVVFTASTQALVALLGGPLTRAHPAVIPNAIELAARGTLVLAMGAWLAPRLAAPVERWALRLGRGSLVAYVVHVPLCYGRPGSLLRGRLSLAECALVAVLMIAGSTLVIWARDAVVGPRGAHLASRVCRCVRCVRR